MALGWHAATDRPEIAFPATKSAEVEKVALPSSGSATGLTMSAIANAGRTTAVAYSCRLYLSSLRTDAWS